MSSVVCGGELLVSVADEEDLVHKSSKPSSDQRPGPVDPVVGPGPAHQGRPKWYCWVHWGTVEGPTCQNVSTHDKTDGNRCNNSQIALLWINGCGVDCVHQPEGHHDLENKRVPHCHSWRQREGAGGLRNSGTQPNKSLLTTLNCQSNGNNEPLRGMLSLPCRWWKT